MSAARPILEIQQEPFEVGFDSLVKNEEGFLKLAILLRERAGINLPLTSKNLSLMAGRLGPLLRRNGFVDYQDLLMKLKTDQGPLFEDFVRVLTTNTTHWFREEQHFQFLAAHLKQSFERAIAHGSNINIWCAAASTGQEPYTLAIVAREAWLSLGKLPGMKMPLRILGTDINQKVLTKAATGYYSEADMRGLSPQFLEVYFSKMKKGPTLIYKVKPELTDLVTFAPLNLLLAQYPFKGCFDYIFCRNVFIYFEKEVCHQIIAKMARHQKSGSLLFLGHSEVGAMKSENYKTSAHAVFERK